MTPFYFGKEGEPPTQEITQVRQNISQDSFTSTLGKRICQVNPIDEYSYRVTGTDKNGKPVHQNFLGGILFTAEDPPIEVTESEKYMPFLKKTIGTITFVEETKK